MTKGAHWRREDSFAALAPRYDGFIFDVWGTLYGGGPVFEGARVVLEQLADLGKPVVILSNAPRSTETVAKRLDPLGIPATLYRGIVTSGSVTRQALIERADPDHGALGPVCHAFGRDRAAEILQGTGFRDGASLSDADWILNAAPEEADDTVEQYLGRLQEAAARGLMMVCANPDIHVVDKTRKLICAGALAAAYEDLGGRVLYHGKPHRPVFDHAADALGLGSEGPEDRSRVLMVGDNLATDVKGAAAVGFDSLLLADGIDADSLLGPDGGLDEASLKSFMDPAGPSPSWVATRLKW